ncbi:MAG TPA: class I SAM-dependent methyltransferase [Ignavibacteriaceae bacterium]
MKTISKICDCADWFDPEFNYVVSNELKESVRFHRKQWEFAMIFLALKKYGFLSADKIGLSVGGGNERVLYSISNYVKKLIVTDLYDENTSWDCARTGDPTEFILNSKPFDVNESKISAMRMDMRNLQFDDNTFDFCYSSCAVEHIGDFDDFVQHFDEVYRCLKEDGIYVFTTEFQFGDTTIKDPNNYIFSPDYLEKILNTIKLTPEVNPDVALINHESNRPFPSNIKNMMITGKNDLPGNIDGALNHVSLMRGKYPFSSILFILRKKSANQNRKKIEFINYSSSDKFLKEGVNRLKEKLQLSDITINPYSSLPDGVSPFCIDHQEYFRENISQQNSDTIFHSDYFWFGNHSRNFCIDIKTDDELKENGTVINLRVHRYPVLNSAIVKCIYEKDIKLISDSGCSQEIKIELEEDYAYAILAKLKSGKFAAKKISITSKPSKSEDQLNNKSFKIFNSNFLTKIC